MHARHGTVLTAAKILIKTILSWYEYNYITMDDKIITFETYHDPMLAHIIRAKLEAHDIPCFIEDDHMSGLNPVYNHAISDIKLKIFERDLNECLRIIDEDNEILLEEDLEIDPETDIAIICPYCASTHVARIEPNTARPSWLNTLYSFFASILPFYSSKQWHCVNCRQDFE